MVREGAAPGCPAGALTSLEDGPVLCLSQGRRPQDGWGGRAASSQGWREVQARCFLDEDGAEVIFCEQRQAAVG